MPQLYPRKYFVHRHVSKNGWGIKELAKTKPEAFEQCTSKLKKGRCPECRQVGTLEWQRDEKGKIRLMDNEFAYIRCGACGWEWWTLKPEGA